MGNVALIDVSTAIGKNTIRFGGNVTFVDTFKLMRGKDDRAIVKISQFWK